MVIRIGEKMENLATNPLGLLSECHRRIEGFLNGMMTVAQQARGSEMDARQRTAFEASLRYFREAAPKHRMDEEESLFPRIAALQRPETKMVLARLAALEKDHAAADAGHAEVEVLGSRWISEGRLPAEAAGDLVERLRHLIDLYQKHIQVEEAEVFPLAGKILEPSEIKIIGEEMAARRQIDLDALKRFGG